MLQINIKNFNIFRPCSGNDVPLPPNPALEEVALGKGKDLEHQGQGCILLTDTQHFGDILTTVVGN